MSRVPHAVLIWTGLLALWIFFPSYASYIWDDRLLVLQNDNTSGFEALGRLWLEDLWARVPGEHAHHWYRPLMTLSLWLDQQLFGQNLTAALLHSALYGMLSAALFWKLLKSWGISTGTAAFVLSLFWLHPLQIEAFRFVAARNDLMSMAALLATALLLQHPKRTWAVSFTVFAALTSKESSLLFLPLLALSNFILKDTKPSQHQYIALAIPILIWAGLRSMVVSGTPSLSIVETLKALPVASACLVVPLSCPAAAPPSALSALAIWGFLPPIIFALACVANRKLGWVALLLGASALLLSAQAGAVSNGMAHRYLLWPLFALCLAIAAFRPCRLPMATPFLMALGLAFLTQHHRDSHWQSTLALWQHAHQKAPSSQSACGIFKQLEQAEHNAEAFPFLLEAVTTPVSLHCCFNASRFPFANEQIEATLHTGHYALEQGCPQSPELLAPLAMAEALTGQWDSAQRHAAVFGTDPWGFGPVILTAAALRKGDEGPLRHWTAHAGLEDTTPLRLRAQRLIDQSAQP